MEALRPDDPRSVGGHRLLGRLGAGGMGVVYLARTRGGALTAVKVIRAEHAEDPRFRGRFRREARAAARIRGRWTVPVVASDPDAREPWLATAFVPGPSLAEAVALLGPLPPPFVAALGARLAEALAEVHAAGLVHRDVKPGNILLDLDGPRLIDFGIARQEGATALTAAGSIVGSPGFLSPEQARGRADGAGPATDVFSLGCVLAYASTGRGPFGTGTPAGILFRTVHEPPDLDGVSERLLPLLEECLDKDPGRRPAPREVRRALAGFAGPPTPGPLFQAPSAQGPAAQDPPAQTPHAQGPAAQGPPAQTPHAQGAAAQDPPPRGPAADPRAALAVPPPGAAGPPAAPGAREEAGKRKGPGAHGGPGSRKVRRASEPAGVSEPAYVLPPALARLVAERSVRALAPPADPETAPDDTPESEDTGPAAGRSGGPAPDGDTAPADALPTPTPHPHPTADTTPAAGRRPRSRRRFLAIGGSAAAAVAAGGGIAAWLDGRSRGASGGTGATGPRPRRTIGLHADLSGPGKTTGRAHERGARLAVEEFNARGEEPFSLALVTKDDRGRARDAERTADAFADDPSVHAVLGPTSDVTARAAVGRYEQALLPMVTAAVGTAAGTTDLSSVYHRVLFRVTADAGLLHLPLLHYLTHAAGAGKTLVVDDRAAGDTSWRLSRAVTSSPPSEGTATSRTVAADSEDFGPAAEAALDTDAVVYTGVSPGRAARLARALRTAGFKGTATATEPVLKRAFLDAAGPDAEGWVFSATFTDPAAHRRDGAERFATAYRGRFGTGTVDRYAAEAYDAVLLIAQGLRELGPERTERGALVRRLGSLTLEGVTKTIAFDDLSRALVADDALFLYRVEDGAPRFLGPYEQVGREN